MSRFGGIVYFDGRPVDRASLAAMAKALRARRPDAENQLIDGAAGFVHLLQGFTPEDAWERQPVVDGESGTVLVCDARLDNREELASLLGVPEAEARKLPDSAFVMRAHRRWGRDGAKHLLGAFAFAFWDARERRLLLGRDQCGERVLYTTRLPGGIAFASAPKGLLALPGVERRLNREKVIAYGLSLPLDEATYFEGIERVLAGHTIEFAAGRNDPRRYWTLEPGDTLRLGSDDEYVEAARDVFGQAVACRLRSAHPVGAFMSGGLDSPAVACTALGLNHGARLPVFTAVPRPGFEAHLARNFITDETPMVEAIGRVHPRLDIHYVRTAERPVLDDLEATFNVIEQPIYDAFNRLWMEAITKEASSRGIGVLLTGNAGNLTLSWGGGRPRKRPRHPLQDWYRRLAPTSLQFHADALTQSLRRTADDRRLIGPRRMPWRKVLPVYRDRLEMAASDSRLRQLMRSEVESAQGNSGWRAELGVELRDPTADRRVIEFCWRIPVDQFQRGRQRRWLIRRMVHGLLPPEVAENKRRGLQSADWPERYAELAPHLSSWLSRIERHRVATELVDVARTREIISGKPTRWSASLTANQLTRAMLMRTLTMGLFLAWVDARTDAR